MAKQRDKHPFEDNPLLDGFLDWIRSPEGHLYDEISETVSFALQKADVDAKKRKIVWEDGQRLSITESAQRIHADHRDFPLELIEESVVSWLEGGFAPDTYSEKQLEELDRLTEKWIDDHERQAEARSKRRRTPHS